MNRLRQPLADYLTLRRSLGYKLERPEKLLGQFIDYLDTHGADTITVESALAWACLPDNGESNWWADRLSVVRGFATYLHTLDPAIEIPAADLLPRRPQRANPYLYSETDIAALIAAAGRLRSPLRVATYQTLIGLLAVTGMRVGEAIRLDRGDFDPATGVLVVRWTKNAKTRELPLHPSTVTAVADYLARPDRQNAAPASPALLISPAGTRLIYCNVHSTFKILRRHAGLTARAGSCRPRIHDVRHTFAVNTLLDAYRHGHDVSHRLALLSTYLGHVDPAGTYWYLSAAPELLGLAAERLDHRPGPA